MATKRKTTWLLAPWLVVGLIGVTGMVGGCGGDGDGTGPLDPCAAPWYVPPDTSYAATLWCCKQSVSVGDPVLVGIVVHGLEGALGVALEVDYEPAKLEVDAVEANTDLFKSGEEWERWLQFEMIEAQAGRLSYSVSFLPGEGGAISGDKRIANIHCVAGSKGVTELRITKLDVRKSDGQWITDFDAFREHSLQDTLALTIK